MTSHQSVLLNESIEGLAIKPNGIYIDGTFGRGGHSQAILARLGPKGRLIAIDKDLEAIKYGQEQFAQEPRLSLVHSSFAALPSIAKQLSVSGLIDGILLDLGVSSPQLDNPMRGFSFMHEGPLDMRMDATGALDATRFVNEASLEEMIDVFRRYGEERFSSRIARALVAARELKPITTTAELAELVKLANPKWEKHKHPATRVFQAIRIHVNQELTDLTHCLDHCLDELSVGGRLVVISFHSLEDRIVKQFMRNQAQGEQLPLSVPVRSVDLKTCFKRIGKAVKASHDEVKLNVRARSAVLRIGEKIA